MFYRAFIPVFDNLRLVLVTLAAVAVSAPLQADTILDEAALEEILARLTQGKILINSNVDTPGQDEGWYKLGMAAYDAATLISKEYASHGELEKTLIDRLVTEAADLGVVIHWSESHQRYYYDGEAFRQYIRQSPQGDSAAACRFKLIEQEFYFAQKSDRDSMIAAAEEKRAFLEEYPTQPLAEAVELYLSIDYRDLWRLCRKDDDRDCAEHYLDMARDVLLNTIKAGNRSKKTVTIATRMLQRIENERVAAQPLR